MEYISTRGDSTRYSSAQVIRQGIAPDGGLFVPVSIPKLDRAQIKSLSEMRYQERAVYILQLFLSDYTHDELTEMVDLAYDEETFGENPALLRQINPYSDQEYMLELWHGPTAAFKDMALQLLPHLMKAALAKNGEDEEICILTATSGDTGKAALEGFKEVEGTSVMVFFPAEGVSPAQRLQMLTQEGHNCHVLAVRGSFDDTQNEVKSIFSQEALRQKLKDQGKILSSANSINWGRLVPQIVYYFSAYADLLKQEKIEPEERINFVVPTGNFGNILAAWYASRMGLPIHKLICASNRNKVLSDFIRSGRYDCRREFHLTNSPSMDILISSNLERLLFELTDQDANLVKTWMEKLQQEGSYEIEKPVLQRLQSLFVGGFCNEKATLKTIQSVYDRTDHLVDTHTAVGFNVYGRYATRSKDTSKTVFVSTASPLKFAAPVSDAIFGQGYSKGRSETVLLEELSQESGIEIPPTLKNLDQKPIQHEETIETKDMQGWVERVLLE